MRVSILILCCVLCSCVGRNTNGDAGEIDSIASARAKFIVDSIVGAAERGESPRQLFFNAILQKEGIYRVTITDVDWLVVSAVNNEEDKTPLARFYIRLAGEYGIDIKGVRIIDEKDAQFGDGYAYGTVLAKVVK